MRMRVIIVFVIIIVFCTGCSKKNTNIAMQTPMITPKVEVQTNTATSGGNEDWRYETTIESMTNFINTVNAETYCGGSFKDVILRIRQDGYIIVPTFDGEISAVLTDAEIGRVVLSQSEPQNGTLPPYFVIHFSDNGFRYRADIYLIKENEASDFAENGFNAINGNYITEAQEYQETQYITETFVSSQGQEMQIRSFSHPLKNADYSAAEVVLEEKFYIRIVGDYSQKSNVYDAINKELLSHIGFTKVYLND